MLRKALVLLALILVGCRGDQTTNPAVGVGLSVTVQPAVAGPDDPATVEARVVNHGPVHLKRGDGCSFWLHGMTLAFLDPHSNPIHLHDPRHQPLCPDRIVGFAPGDDLEGTVGFDGIVYSDSGERFGAPSGRYTVIVRFQAWGDDEDAGSISLERRATFRWIAD
ncbi:MAG: hypothetical protein OEN01_12785 [Candidatus Krumholzibacteria bacterium]|nr:hypothetical protein [Candidatus Krumholzibacteria bacterium]